MSELFVPIAIGLAAAVAIGILATVARDVQLRREASRPISGPELGRRDAGLPLAARRGRPDAGERQGARLVAVLALGAVLAASAVGGALALGGQLDRGEVAGATSSPAASRADGDMPEPVRAGLSRVLEANTRLRSNRVALTGELAAEQVDSASIVTILRAVERQAELGGDLVPQVASWAPSTGLAEELRRFYAAVRVKARDAVAAVRADPAAARASGETLVRSLELLGGIDERVLAIAAESGVELGSVPAATLGAP